MKEQAPAYHSNAKLLSLIELWVKADDDHETYDDVIFELENGNSFLIIETRSTLGNNKMFDTEKDAVLEIPYNVVEGEKYFCAFTDFDQFEEFTKHRKFYTIMDGRHLLEMVERDDLAGFVINANTDSTFVAYRRRDTELEELFNL